MRQCKPSRKSWLFWQGGTLSEQRDTFTLLEAIQKSPGMAHVNRSHLRSFSFNIFVINAQELIEVTQQVQDPDEGLRLMSLANKEAGQQTHREVNRRIHNFAVSALTLVEHTRIFMREHYGRTSLLDRYEAKAKEEFATDPVSQFVQKLRNYMVHKGLPDSEMYLHMEQDPANNQGAALQTGVRLKAKNLLEWDGWGDTARSYIESCGDYLNIQEFTMKYTGRVVAFHEWLQFDLDQYHGSDLADLQKLQAEFQSREENPASSRPPNTSAQPLAAVVRSEDISDKIRQTSLSILGKIRKLELANANEHQFKSQRPVGATLTDKDMIGTPLVWGNDIGGHRVFAFILRNGGVCGLDEENYLEVRPLIEAVLQLPWATNSLSRDFIEKTTIGWLQSSYGEEAPALLETYLESKAREAVRPLTLWAPVAHFEIEAPFSFGPIEVRPITAAMIDELKSQLTAARPQEEENVKVLFDRLRDRMQGFAAIVIKMTGDSERLKEEGAETAKAAVGLLRFISPAAANPTLISGVALLGKELIPAHHLIVLGDGTFSYAEGMEIQGAPGMQIPEGAFNRFKPAFDALGALVRPEGLTPFAFVVRASLLLFSTGLTLSDTLDRLSYSVSAMEKLLLRHSAEKPEFNVAERMRLILSRVEEVKDVDVPLTAREAYRLLARRDLAPLAPYQRDAALQFSLDAYRVLRVALNNTKRFQTMQEFVDSIDQLA
jgi:hypothetical protein